MRQGEELFRMGLVEQALHVWTRILFLDRGNVGARRAIERAKRTLAERQRRLDVEVVAAAELLDDGRVATAGEKIRDVLAADPRHREGLQLADEIAALERRAEIEKAPDTPEKSEAFVASKRGLLLRVARTRPGSDRAAGRRRAAETVSPVKMAGFALGAILVFASGALYLHLNWDAIVSDGAFGTAGALAPQSAPELGAPVPDSSELRYYNAERLVAKGRDREALEELGRVDRASPVFERARSLMLRLEARLLRGGASEPDDRGRSAAELEGTR